jgi:carboxypeptidase C (cathepsin A)
MELQTVESHFVQRGWSTRDQYGRCVPQEICGSRRPRRSGAARCLRSHFVSVPGRFIVAFHQTATTDRTPSFPVIRPIAARARYVHRTAGPHHHPLTIKWKISALGWTKNRLPITRSKLAYEVAKKLKLYLDNIAVRSYRNGVDFSHSQTT